VPGVDTAGVADCDPSGEPFGQVDGEERLVGTRRPVPRRQRPRGARDERMRRLHSMPPPEDGVSLLPAGKELTVHRRLDGRPNGSRLESFPRRDS
jgi:hypothetical protein